MKTITISTMGAAALFVLMGAGVFGYALQEHQGGKQDHAGSPQGAQGQSSPAQHAQPQQQQRTQQPQQQQRAQQPQQQQRAQQPQQQRAQQQRMQQQPSNQVRQQRGVQNQPQQTRGNDRFQRTPEQQHFQQSVWQQHRAGNWQSDHRNWQQRGGYNGFRIPSDRFNGYFGQGHGFRIGGLPFLVVGGYPRFQYGGYWFSMVDPYPGDWAYDWYDTDDVYVMYSGDGYYLYNRSHPGVGIAISISM